MSQDQPPPLPPVFEDTSELTNPFCVDSKQQLSKASAHVLENEKTEDSDFQPEKAVQMKNATECKFLEDDDKEKYTEPMLVARNDLESFYVKSKHDSHYYLLKTAEVIGCVMQVNTFDECKVRVLCKRFEFVDVVDNATSCHEFLVNVSNLQLWRHKKLDYSEAKVQQMVEAIKKATEGKSEEKTEA